MLKLGTKILQSTKVIKMPSENDVLEIQNKCIMVLNAIYDLKKQGKDNTHSSEIITSTKLEAKELHDILYHLIEQGWIKQKSSIENIVEKPGGVAIDSTIEITDTGVLYIENTKKLTNN